MPSFIFEPGGPAGSRAAAALGMVDYANIFAPKKRVLLGGGIEPAFDGVIELDQKLLPTPLCFTERR
jgi:hypothetical protein